MPPVTTRSEPRLSRPQRVAEAIKGWVMQEGWQPGHRLPSESALIARFAMAKGTIREAIRILEAQGLVTTRTGPGGGVFVHRVSEGRAAALLGNYFYFAHPSIDDIYQIRAALEPELAASLAGRLSPAQLAQLQAAIDASADAADAASQPTAPAGRTRGEPVADPDGTGAGPKAATGQRPRPAAGPGRVSATRTGGPRGHPDTPSAAAPDGGPHRPADTRDADAAPGDGPARDAWHGDARHGDGPSEDGHHGGEWTLDGRCGDRPAGKTAATPCDALRHDLGAAHSGTAHDEATRHAASLRFHALLAGFSDNAMLAFVIRFTAEMLGEVTVTRGLHTPTDPALWQAGLAHQRRLLAALRAGDAETARTVMQAHMAIAHRLMRAREAAPSRRFLRDRGAE